MPRNSRDPLPGNADDMFNNSDDEGDDDDDDGGGGGGGKKYDSFTFV